MAGHEPGRAHLRGQNLDEQLFESLLCVCLPEHGPEVGQLLVGGQQGHIVHLVLQVGGDV